MDESQYSLFWESHKNNVCRGLCSLQQKEEFVDMTLAADGHFVKVHQVVIALASPYLKEILASIDSKYPVIYLNNISYTVLSKILEYIYTGEVVIPLDTLRDVVTAGKNLCIKGIENVVLQREETSSKVDLSESKNIKYDDYGMVSIKQSDQQYTETDNQAIMNTATRNDNEEMQYEFSKHQIDNDDLATVHTDVDPISIKRVQHTKACSEPEVDLEKDKSIMQYTVSNQGSIQLILNRFIYYLKHTNKNGERHWRCVNYVKNRCPAIVVTNDEMVLKRCNPHIHGLHDAKILRKIRNGNVYKEVITAVSNCEHVKKQLSLKKLSSDGD